MSAQLRHGIVLASHSDTSAQLRRSIAFATLPDTSAQMGHGKTLTLPIRSFDFACAKAWQTLAAITLVRSSKTRLSLSQHARSTLRDQAVNTNFGPRHSPAMRHPVHLRLAVRIADHNDDVL